MKEEWCRADKRHQTSPVPSDACPFLERKRSHTMTVREVISFFFTLHIRGEIPSSYSWDQPSRILCLWFPCLFKIKVNKKREFICSMPVISVRIFLFACKQQMLCSDRWQKFSYLYGLWFIFWSKVIGEEKWVTFKDPTALRRCEKSCCDFGFS